MNAETQHAGAGSFGERVRRLSEACLAAAQVDATPLKVRHWVGYDDRRQGWCVHLNMGCLLGTTLLAGPFATREEAESHLGLNCGNWICRETPNV